MQFLFCSSFLYNTYNERIESHEEFFYWKMWCLYSFFTVMTE